ncbi:vesicle fusion protein [Thecamonas trahens ATCC 50062]|uniref:Vesicle fusion protein n=1 Tax=Thecamonas trahens ATCC 50062 TaxID=461836 RepID=A0A0L0DVL7_THETB|nr:vesicle fusion protein [Thecamonas trahens ATCC 50062]KNC56116.1 vesicle fusion protein [Thecamonas trahens ATCC 50062]|eukprot:XP_013761158.1 vesicle fusion protein [Thecamonas trahens ATCC 50062]
MTEERVMVALADTYVHILRADDIEVITKLSATKGASSYALDASGLTPRLAVCTRKKLLFFRWAPEQGTFAFWKELVTPQEAKAIVWAGDSVCVGFRREYSLIHVSSGSTTELFPTGGGEPSCLLVPDANILLGKEHLSVFVGYDGKPSRKQALAWSELPLAVAYSFPYVLGLLSKSIEVRSMHTQNLVQAIPLTKPRFLTAKGSAVYVATTYSIFRLIPFPLPIQINELVEERLYEEAICLTEVAPGIESIKRQEQLLYIRMLYAFSLFVKGSYDAAMRLFFQLKVNPAQIISLFPDLLPMEMRLGYKYPFNMPELTGTQLDAALEALVKYLPQVRSALIRQAQSRTARAALLKFEAETGEAVLDDTLAKPASDAASPDVAGPSSGPELDPAEDTIDPSRIVLLGTLSSGSTIMFVDPADPSTVLTLFRDTKVLRQIVDTSLLKAYLKVQPSLARSLLRIDNACHVEECEDVLIKAAKFEELVLLYKSKGLHRKSLEMLRKLAKNHSTGPMSGPTPSIEYLRDLGVDHLDLILEFSVWILASHPKSALSIFTHDNEAVRSLPMDSIVAHIESHAPTVAQAYLEYVVFDRKSTSSKLHNKLAFTYLNAVVTALKAAPRAKSAGPVKVANERGTLATVRGQLLDFLRASTHYEPARILSRLAQLKLEETELYEERAVLLAGLGSHEEALIIYVYGLADHDMAVEHCNRYYDPELESHRDVYLTLLKVYLAPPETIPAQPEPAMDLLNAYSSRIDIPRALELLPPDTPLASLLPFFDAVLKSKSELYRRNLVLRNLLRSENLLVREQLIQERSRYVVIEENRMCGVCHKRILSSQSFAVYPNNVVVHYRCASKDRDVCP